MNDIKVIDDLICSLYFYNKDKTEQKRYAKEILNAWESITRRLKNDR